VTQEIRSFGPEYVCDQHCTSRLFDCTSKYAFLPTDHNRVCTEIWYRVDSPKLLNPLDDPYKL